jgi:hypothetical protein
MIRSAGIDLSHVCPLDGDGTQVADHSLYDENLEGGLARPRQRRAKD